MPFEALAARHNLVLPDFPAEWLPLTYLYDPDLPLFPILYFHALDPDLPAGQRPSYRDRVFGFVQNVNLTPKGATADIILNKDLSLPSNLKYLSVVKRLVRDRLGLGEPITPQIIKNGLKKQLSSANGIVEELWHQVVAPAFGNMLPFGRNWDAVFGLIRFIASWYSGQGGRKSELIQTHYFASAFGERIAAGNNVNVDFYLLPTFEELQEMQNPISIFPKFSELVAAADGFVSKYCNKIKVGPSIFSAFDKKKALGNRKGNLNTGDIIEIINREDGATRDALFENYNAFNRGPRRSIIALMMIHDLRTHGWDPTELTPHSCAEMYEKLKRSYQTPKVLQLYAQQCFGSHCALPIDNWVTTFIQWPLGFQEKLTRKGSHALLFDCSDVWGKLERIIWISVQARKVHSSVCAEILWCIRFGGPNKQMRGANPLSCKICLSSVRKVCPAYDLVKRQSVKFNSSSIAHGFSISSSERNSNTPNQSIIDVTGAEIFDEYSARDRASKFESYPQPQQFGTSFTVEDFLKYY